MKTRLFMFLTMLALFPTAGAHAGAAPLLRLHTRRSSSQDLAVSGNFLPPGATRFIPLAELLRLPQVQATVIHDSNFDSPVFHPAGSAGSVRAGVKISGVSLDSLASALGTAARAELVSAVCDDNYEAHYSPAYRAAHQPILVLRINGRMANQWPRPAGTSYGPYLISHANFVSRLHVDSQPDEPQIPYAVVMLKFADELSFERALAAPGSGPGNLAQKAVAAIAQQNCLRCHDAGEYGGRKAYRSFAELGRLAASHPDYFAGYVRNPRSRNIYSHMPANPDFDDRTLSALLAYFKTFYNPRP